MTRTWGWLWSLLLLAACTAPAGVYHTVQEGQTLYRISRVYEVDELYLARINGIDDPTRLPAGEKIFVPGAKELRQVPVSFTPAPPPPAPAASPAAQPVSTPAATPTPATTPTPAPVTTPPEAPASVTTGQPTVTQGKFNWPLQGTVLRRFGQGPEPPCKGLEIGAEGGSPVVSAAAGRVIYSGDGIKGFGNLIILKHDNSFFTVYGFNQKNLVSTGAFVSKGEKIALSGVPPGGGAPRLHFEIRYGKRAVDPLPYLP